MSRTVLFAEVPHFYATVARSDAPALGDRPIVVGGDPRKRGSVVDASPDALRAGVTLEMTMLEALRLCPRARPVRTDMPRYREVSRRLFACLRRGLGRIEPFGLGAAYFELTGATRDPDAIARTLRERVRDELGLPLRVGIAPGKFLARLAAEESGERAVRHVAAGGEAAFLRPLAVTRLDGVGRKTAATLAELGVRTIGEAAALGRERLEEVFGTHGLRIHALATGTDDGPVRAAPHPQSLSREATLAEGALDRVALGEQLRDLAAQLEEELALQGLAVGKVTLKLRYADGVTSTRSLTLGARTAAAGELLEVAMRLLDRTQAGSRPVRGLGLQLGRMAPEGERDRQLDLFSPSS